MINDLILAPLLMLFLILGGVGLLHARRSHGRAAPLRIHIASSLVLLIFTFVVFVPVLMGLGMVGLLGAVGVDIWASRTTKKQCG